jgi:hypothetical protein
MLERIMGPKLAINLLAFGVGGTLLFVFESIMEGTPNPVIVIPVIMAIVGGVGVLRLRYRK